MKVKGVIFDVDGVLLDTMHVWTDAGARYLATLGVSAEPGLGDKLFTMTVDMGAVYVKERYGLTQTTTEITRGINHAVEDYYALQAAWKPGAKALLQRLKAAGIPDVYKRQIWKYCPGLRRRIRCWICRMRYIRYAFLSDGRRRILWELRQPRQPI